jgi:putative salt-induced outer membrane protein YdiY
MRILSAALLAALCFPAAAITNVEEKRAVDEKPGWHSKAEVGFDAESGNNEKRKWRVGLNTSWQNETDRFFAWGNRAYGSSNGARTDDDTFFHARFVHNHMASWSQEGFAQFERDPFAALLHRMLIGAGVRYQQSFAQESRWFQGAGIFHEQLQERAEGSEYSNQLTRLNLYSHLQWRLNPSMIQTTIYVQPSVDDTDDVRALWQLAITLPVASQTDLKWQWQSRWDTKPPEGTEYHNHQTHLTLAFRF